MKSEYAIFTTEVPVRPDDIDGNGHVHSPKYFDYVLAARLDQMGRCYKMPMEDFLERGLNWFVRACHIQHKRELKLGDVAVVATSSKEVARRSCSIRFEITRKSDGKVAALGGCEYALIDIQAGRAIAIPEDIVEVYSVRD